MLIADAGKEALAGVALRLLRLRVDLHYARDADEAQLLAAEDAPRIGVLLFGTDLPVDDLQRIRRRLAAGAPDGRRALVVVGPRPDDDACRALRTAGTDFALWDRSDESALRSVLAMALSPWPWPGSEARRHPRAPTNLLARAFVGARRRDVIASSLSVGGAFLETPGPFPEGTALTVELPLPEGDVTLKARVVYAHYGSEVEPFRPTGMGVEFAPMDDAARARLHQAVEGIERQFRV